MAAQAFLTEDISRHVWRTKYCYRTAAGAGDETIEDTWRRIARALAAVDLKDQELWAERFYDILAASGPSAHCASCCRGWSRWSAWVR